MAKEISAGSNEAFKVLYAEPDLCRFGVLEDGRLDGLTERHPLELRIPWLQSGRDIRANVLKSGARGLILSIPTGYVDRAALHLARTVLAASRKVWFYRPRERAIECIDADHLRSYRHLWAAVGLQRGIETLSRMVSIGRRPAFLKKPMEALAGKDLARRMMWEIQQRLPLAQPLRLAALKREAAWYRIAGTGVVLDLEASLRARMDADALERVTEHLVRLVAGRPPLPAPAALNSEDDRLRANTHCYALLRSELESLRPAYLYERLSLHNFCGARLSQELRIPYIVAYDGVDASNAVFTILGATAEILAFRQATAVMTRSTAVRDELVQRGVPADKIVLGSDFHALCDRLQPPAGFGRGAIGTGDSSKDAIQDQWDNSPCGGHYVRHAALHSLDWYLEVQRHRYREYAPWMPEVMEFAAHSGKQLLEIGAGLGTDLAQFALHGAVVTDLDLSSGHLALAQENFRLRGLKGRFIHHDAETLPFEDNTFDVVYSNGVIHHTPNTAQVVAEMYRVLKPGGRIVVMVYAENSWHYWAELVHNLGLERQWIECHSMGQLMSETVEVTATGARPLVKVYTGRRLRDLFAAFEGAAVVKRQLSGANLPRLLRWLPESTLERALGWNLILKANKPAAAASGRSVAERFRRSA